MKPRKVQPSTTAAITQARVLAAVTQLAHTRAAHGLDSWVRVADIAIRIDMSKESTRVYLTALVAEGVLVRKAAGTARLFMPVDLSTTPPTHVLQ